MKVTLYFSGKSRKKQVTKGLPEVINYEQLYAQAISEIRSGVRYWLNSEEESIVKKSNRLFEVLPPAEQLLLRYYRSAEEGEQGERLLAVEILTRLPQKSGVKPSATKITTFRRILRKLEIPAGRSNSRMRYHVVEC